MIPPVQRKNSLLLGCLTVKTKTKSFLAFTVGFDNDIFSSVIYLVNGYFCVGKN